MVKKEWGDEWGTPGWLFDQLKEKYNITLDVCASAENTKCRNYFDIDYDALSVRWVTGDNGSCFMNPPYSNPRPWVEYAWEQSKTTTVICLLKTDHSTQWWATFWDFETNGPKPGCEVIFLRKRIKFVAPEAVIREAFRTGKKFSGPTFPSSVIVMDRGEKFAALNNITPVD